MVDLYTNFCKINMDDINNIAIEGLKQIDIDIEKGVTLIYKLYESGLNKIYSLEGYTKLQLERGQIIYSLSILLLVFISLIEKDVINTKELYGYIKTNVHIYFYLQHLL